MSGTHGIYSYTMPREEVKDYCDHIEDHGVGEVISIHPSGAGEGGYVVWWRMFKEPRQTMEAKLEEALEAIRLTQEFAQLPAVAGWSWYDVYKKYRPEDARRLRLEWHNWMHRGTTAV